MSPIEDSNKKSQASSKRKQTAKPSKKNWNDYKFVEIPLSSDQKERVKTTDPDYDRIFEWLELMLDDGHKLSTKLEKKSGAYLTTLTGVVETCPNYGLILTSRAPTYLQSLWVLYFKSEIVMDGLPWQDDSQETDLWG